MATTIERPESRESFDGGFQPPASSRTPRKRGRRLGWLLLALAVVAVLIGGGVLYASKWTGNARAASLLTHTVERSDLLVTITEEGSIESANNIDVKCQVAGGSTILWIVEDGKEVREGEEIVRLDSSAIEDSINSQRITFEKAQAARIQAEKEFSAAKIAVQEYLEGAYVQELQTIETNITIAMENLRSAQNMAQHTQRMARKGYVTSLQREAQEFAVERAKLDLATAQTAKHVLEKFTKAKMLEELESARDSAEARMRSETAAFELEQARLNRLIDQLKNCVITAPQDGMVVYANEEGGGRFSSQQQPTISEGAAVRERQSIVKIPDLTKMQVKVAVHESKVDQVRPGMRARIQVQDMSFQGSVVSVARQAEPTSFFMGNVKQYPTIVRIDGDVSQLRPGMTAVVQILVANVPDALTVPIQSVAEVGGSYFAWVQTPEGPRQTEVEIGPANETSIQIVKGLNEGDRVILNPRSAVAISDPNARSKPDLAKLFGVDDAPSTLPEGATPSLGGPAAPAGGPPAGIGGPPGQGGPPGMGAPGAGGPPGAAGQGPGGPGGGRSRFDFMQFDKDGDGKVSKDEAPEFMRDGFDRMDKDSDGFIDASEAAAMRSMRPRPGAGGPGGPGGEGPGGFGGPNFGGGAGPQGPPGGAPMGQ